MISPGSQLEFQFIPKVFDGVEVRALCRLVKFFHTDLDKPFLYGPHFVHVDIVMLKQERGFPKLLPQSTQLLSVKSLFRKKWGVRACVSACKLAYCPALVAEWKQVILCKRCVNITYRVNVV